eukprot:TRINITY_DN7996_c0_g1_i1.p2 TRINITY_DN7996_c0_g1~~TRINITY_DN7996_c0_g1_i1.p2  ORF type:complete len:179 (-),score=64.55 TRINITY_DN7996_c0_g1_i1:75-575(-)
MEPRLWMCPWKKEFLLECTGSLKKVKSDILVIQMALRSHKKPAADGEKAEELSSVFKLLSRIPESRDMALDLLHTLDDAHKLSLTVLRFTSGDFNGLSQLSTVDDLDKLDGIEEALRGLATLVKFPEKAPKSMEDDELVQLSIVFIMLEYLVSHVAEITKAAVKLC